MRRGKPPHPLPQIIRGHAFANWGHSSADIRGRGNTRKRLDNSPRLAHESWTIFTNFA